LLNQRSGFIGFAFLEQRLGLPVDGRELLDRLRIPALLRGIAVNARRRGATGQNSEGDDGGNPQASEPKAIHRNDDGRSRIRRVACA